MTDDLEYPEVITYFIAWENGILTYGVNKPDQCTATGLDHFEIFTDMGLYLARLTELGIDLDNIEYQENL